MEVWTPDMKLENKSYQIMLKEMIPGKIAISRLVTIENGEIIEKSDDVQLLGILTPEGFVVTGLQIIKGISENHPWMKLCDLGSTFRRKTKGY